jgi:hypothetical protein
MTDPRGYDRRERHHGPTAPQTRFDYDPRYDPQVEELSDNEAVYSGAEGLNECMLYHP